MAETLMLHEIENTKSFILAGNAEFKITNLNSNNHFIYHVTKSDNNSHLYFVNVKEGHSWVYAGFLSENNDNITYKQGNKGSLQDNSPAIKGLLWAIKHGNKPLTRPMVLTHLGKCAYCHKKLTDDISIQRGFGPVCWKKMF